VESQEKTKTTESKAPVPILPLLADLLETHRNGFLSNNYIFAGEKMGRPLNLANLARRVIVPKLNEAGVKWHGWHAFRRGLATNLYNLNVPETDIQAIMRHADIETTRKHYIKKNMVQQRSQDAIRTLEKAFRLLRKSRISVGTNVGTEEHNRKPKKTRLTA